MAPACAFDKQSGTYCWKSQNDEQPTPRSWSDHRGVRQVIYFSADALMGLQHRQRQVALRVPSERTPTPHAATPILFGDSVIVNSADHHLGLPLLQNHQ